MTWHVLVVTSFWQCDVWIDGVTNTILDTGDTLKRFRRAPYMRLLRWVKGLRTFQRIEIIS
ncbi:MAG TPA: hypothetical protein VFD70_24465 [Anaerolineae bacterium]|nr:hypothetical protein [Anaerolineae bacterium]